MLVNHGHKLLEIVEQTCLSILDIVHSVLKAIICIVVRFCGQTVIRRLVPSGFQDICNHVSTSSIGRVEYSCAENLSLLSRVGFESLNICSREEEGERSGSLMEVYSRCYSTVSLICVHNA
jgi:hypothetical protein